uniref:Uncharacterized protein n=1 Tax=Tanacetum cinerariifolium TaxID=118510 RepID=A0A699GDU4_TANCI|nr:hypothetical protein [Tanacetum cinerariifolium]
MGYKVVPTAASAGSLSGAELQGNLELLLFIWARGTQGVSPVGSVARDPLSILSGEDNVLWPRLGLSTLFWLLIVVISRVAAMFAGVAGLPGFVFGSDISQLPDKPRGKNCQLVAPTLDAGEEAGHGYLIQISPRTKDIDSNYSGCQAVFWKTTKEPAQLAWLVEVVNGDPVRRWSSDPAMREILQCHYTHGALIKGNPDVCPVPPKLLMASKAAAKCYVLATGRERPSGDTHVYLLPMDFNEGNSMLYSKIVSCYEGLAKLEGRTIRALYSEYSFAALRLDKDEVINFAVKEVVVGKWFEVFPICLIIGAGTAFGSGGDDFAWMDAWGRSHADKDGIRKRPSVLGRYTLQMVSAGRLTSRSGPSHGENSRMLPLMNDTKWDELRLAMYELGPLSPKWRTLDVENGHLSEWDGEWFYHFRNGGYKFIKWVEIAIESPAQRQAVLTELVKTIDTKAKLSFLMTILTRVSDVEANLIHQRFPLFEKVLEKESDGGMKKIAISVFDHWLRDESEWHLMDCFEGPERIIRDRKLEAHWAEIFDLTPAYTIRYRGRWPDKAKMVLKRYTNREGFLSQSRLRMTKRPSQFLILPELECIYAAGWDDTNILYFKNQELVKPVLDLATKVGLFHLNYEETPEASVTSTLTTPTRHHAHQRQPAQQHGVSFRLRHCCSQAGDRQRVRPRALVFGQGEGAQLEDRVVFGAGVQLRAIGGQQVGVAVEVVDLHAAADPCGVEGDVGDAKHRIGETVDIPHNEAFARTDDIRHHIRVDLPLRRVVPRHGELIQCCLKTAGSPRRSKPGRRHFGDRVAQAGVDDVPAAYHGNAIAKFGDLGVVEMRFQQREIVVGRVRVGQGVDGLGPIEGGAFAVAEKRRRRFAPAGNRVQVARFHVLLDQVAPVHVHAHAAAVELRDAQVDQLHQAQAQRAFFDRRRQRDHGMQVGGGGAVKIGDAVSMVHDDAFQGRGGRTIARLMPVRRHRPPVCDRGRQITAARPPACPDCARPARLRCGHLRSRTTAPIPACRPRSAAGRVRRSRAPGGIARRADVDVPPTRTRLPRGRRRAGCA